MLQIVFFSDKMQALVESDANQLGFKPHNHRRPIHRAYCAESSQGLEGGKIQPPKRLNMPHYF